MIERQLWRGSTSRWHANRCAWARAALIVWAGSAAASFAQAPAAQKPESRAQRAARTGVIELRPPTVIPFLGGSTTAPAGYHAPEDPHDLHGNWTAGMGVGGQSRPLTTVEGEPLPYNAAAQNILWHRLNMTNLGTPVAEPGVVCRPAGLLRVGLSGQIVQDKHKLVLLTGPETEGHPRRIIWLDEKHPAHLKPSYLGHSVGHWEGNTLVIDTIGFNGKPNVDFSGSPSSGKMHVIERVRKVDLGGAYPALQVLTTVEDPEYYTKPWTILKTYQWRPDRWAVGEYNCEENTAPESLDGIQFENPSLLTGR